MINDNEDDVYNDGKLLGKLSFWQPSNNSFLNEILHIYPQNMNWVLKLDFHDLFNQVISGSNKTKIDAVSFDLELDNGCFLHSHLRDSSVIIFDNSSNVVHVWITPVIGSWKGNFTPIQYFDKLVRNFEKNENIGCSYGKYDQDFADFSIALEFDFSRYKSLKIGYVHNEIISALNEIMIQTEKQINAELFSNSLIEEFYFPESVRPACEQYLIYFVQFLSDLGIEVSSGIQSEASKTLFTITPNDENLGLTQIRDALYVYLHLPFEEDFENENNEIAIRQLISNIYHFKSQLILSNALLEAKDATISSLNLTIYQQKVLLDQQEKVDSEKFFGGIIEIKKYDSKKGITIDLPKLLRVLRRRSM